MKSFSLTAILIACMLMVHAQHNFMVFKKNKKGLHYYFINTPISFQLKNEEWITGIITAIGRDSFYLQKIQIQNSLFRTDTLHYAGFGYSLNDVAAFLKSGFILHEVGGRNEINRAAGHVHWYWVKSGWIFRVGAAGYAFLNLANRLLNHKNTYAGGEFGTAAAVFLGGVALKAHYQYRYKLGKRYHLEIVNLTN